MKKPLLKLFVATLLLELLSFTSSQAQSVSLGDTLRIEKHTLIFNYYQYYYRGTPVSLQTNQWLITQVNDSLATRYLHRSFANFESGKVLYYMWLGGLITGSAYKLAIGKTIQPGWAVAVPLGLAVLSIYPSLRARRLEKKAALRYNQVIREQSSR